MARISTKTRLSAMDNIFDNGENVMKGYMDGGQWQEGIDDGKILDIVVIPIFSLFHVSTKEVAPMLPLSTTSNPYSLRCKTYLDATVTNEP